MKQKINTYLFSTWIVGLLIVLVLFYFPKESRHPIEETVSEIKNWTQVIDGNDELEIYLPQRIQGIEKAKVEIYTYLPEDFETAQTICFWSYFQEVDVYLEDTLIYSNGEEENRFGEVVAARWNYIEIPGNSDGDKLRIVLTVPYDSCIYSVEEIVYGSAEQLQKWMIKSYGRSCIMDITLKTVGIGFIIYAFLKEFDRKYKFSYLYFGITVFLFGLHCQLGVKGIVSYWIPPYFRALIAYLAFFLLPIALTLYVRMRMLKINLVEKICTCLIGVQCVEVFTVFLLHALGIRDIYENIFLGQGMLVIAAIWALFSAIAYAIKVKEKKAVLTVINTLLLVVAVHLAWLKKLGLLLQISTDFIVRFWLILIILIEFFVFYMQMKQNDNSQKRLEKENKNLQLQVLTGQIRPHFILNTLGAIRTLICHEPEKASDLLYDFSKYIRKNMEQKDYTKVVPFLEELDYIETYLNLEKLRFDDKLEVDYDIREDGFWILPLTIQPFVENAVKHGLLPAKSGGTIWISTLRTEKWVEVEIRDNGIGFDAKNFRNSMKEQIAVGMKSAIFRLENEMGAICDVYSSTAAGNSGTCIKIKIPEKEAFRNENNNRR